MNHWIFIVTNQKTDDGTVPAREIYQHRMADHFWGLGKSTPNRRGLATGDQVLFYVGTPERAFAGTATIAGESFKLTPEQTAQFTRAGVPYETEYGVMLSDIDMWAFPKFAPDLVPHLSFIENKQYWGSYFQGGVRGLPEADYLRIVDNGTPNALSIIDDVADDALVEAQQFALEAHLEEFLFANWSSISWPSDLTLYTTDGSNGRQFPAGSWSIDFLAIDRSTNDLVVIELKRGQTSDATVGQMLRYRGWVSENLAEPGQHVRGVIVCQAIDEALRYAVKGMQDITVMTYQVDFNLTSIDL